MCKGIKFHHLPTKKFVVLHHYNSFTKFLTDFYKEIANAAKKICKLKYIKPYKKLVEIHQPL